ncbi:MAG: dTMP kinase, partial [Acidimicrobiia bacterium]
YIALEGIEGAGKSTVAAQLAEALRSAGHDVRLVREPGGTSPGELIRSVLLDAREENQDLAPWTEALLFAASRAQLVRDVVRPALDKGEIVISDRSVYSSLAYQGGGRGLGVEEVRGVNSPGLEGTWPTLVVLLQIDPSAGLSRQEIPDRIGAEGVEFQAAVAATFAAMAEALPERFLTVDAAADLDDVVGQIVREIERRW